MRWPQFLLPVCCVLECTFMMSMMSMMSFLKIPSIEEKTKIISERVDLQKAHHAHHAHHMFMLFYFALEYASRLK